MQLSDNSNKNYTTKNFDNGNNYCIFNLLLSDEIIIDITSNDSVLQNSVMPKNEGGNTYLQ